MADQIDDQSPSPQPQFHPLAQPINAIVDDFINSDEFKNKIMDFQAGLAALPAAEKEQAESHFKMAVTKPMCSACCAGAGFVAGSAAFKSCVNECLSGTGPCSNP